MTNEERQGRHANGEGSFFFPSSFVFFSFPGNHFLLFLVVAFHYTNA